MLQTSAAHMQLPVELLSVVHVITCTVTLCHLYVTGCQLVGLRVPDDRHGQPHRHRGQQHLEQHPHRHGALL